MTNNAKIIYADPENLELEINGKSVYVPRFSTNIILFGYFQFGNIRSFFSSTDNEIAHCMAAEEAIYDKGYIKAFKRYYNTHCRTRKYPDTFGQIQDGESILSEFDVMQDFVSQPAGRIYTDYNILTAWYKISPMQMVQLVKDFQNELSYDISDCTYAFMGNNKQVFQWKISDYIQGKDNENLKAQDMSKKMNIHLLNAKEKANTDQMRGDIHNKIKMYAGIEQGMRNNGDSNPSIAKWHNQRYEESMNHQIKNILREEIQKYVILENASPVLFHFCTLPSLIQKLKTNSFPLSVDNRNFSKNGKPLNFMSLTRNRNIFQGYPYMMKIIGGGDGMQFPDEALCRIELDGNILNLKSNFKQANGNKGNFNVKPFDWWYVDDQMSYDNFGELGDEYMFPKTSKEYSLWAGKRNNDNEDMYNQPLSQAEDRLLSQSKVIPNADKYIKRIDILLNPLGQDENPKKTIRTVINLKKNSIFGNIIHVYSANQYKDFNYQTGNSLPLIKK